jgi:hypothetical protein
LSRDGVSGALRGSAWHRDADLGARLARHAERGGRRRGAGSRRCWRMAGFPIIVRPLGSHTGANLEKIATPAALGKYLAAVDGMQFHVSRFVDYRSADGLFRKYRIALIDGQPYLCHHAISQRWMIDYQNAGMNKSAEKRAEEAACLAGFERGFGLRHRAALQSIQQRLGLPYLCVDCAEMPSGELLIFEVDNAMIVHGMDPVDMFPYKVARDAQGVQRVP